LGKLASSVFGRQLGEWAPVLLGPEGGLVAQGYGPAAGNRTLQMRCVNSPATAIAGGTDQIQRNIIGDRVLGLPREPAVDRGMPWSQTARNG
jgi:hypothetical protein